MTVSFDISFSLNLSFPSLTSKWGSFALGFVCPSIFELAEMSRYLGLCVCWTLFSLIFSLGLCQGQSVQFTGWQNVHSSPSIRRKPLSRLTEVCSLKGKTSSYILVVFLKLLFYLVYLSATKVYNLIKTLSSSPVHVVHIMQYIHIIYIHIKSMLEKIQLVNLILSESLCCKF